MAKLCRYTKGRKAGLYYADYYELTLSGERKRRRVSLKTRNEDRARERYAEIVQKAEVSVLAPDGKKRTGLSDDTTVRELCRWYTEEVMVARGNTADTRWANEVIFGEFVEFLGGLKIATASQLAASKTGIDAYAAHLQRRHKPRTARNKLTKVRAVFRAAVARGLIPRMPADEWPMPKRRKEATDSTITAAQYRAILDALKGHALENAIRFMAAVGCRPSDVCGLTWDRINLQRREVAICQQKTGDWVVIPLVGMALEAVFAQPRGKSHYVFPDRRDKKLRRNQLQNTLEWYSRTRGIGHITPKSFRQYVVTELLDAGCDRETIALITGHRSDSMEAYAKRRMERARRAAEEFARRQADLSSSGTTGTPAS